MIKRTFATSQVGFRGLIRARVFPEIKNAEELAKFLKTPSGNVHDSVPGPVSVVNSKVVRKMLQLSGLESNISKEMEQKWIDALNTQIGFISQLQMEEVPQGDVGKTNSEAFRLIKSDHQPSQPLNLNDLMKQVKENIDQSGDENFSDFGKTINCNVKV